MSASEFDIIFRGDIVFGHQLADVKAKLQQLFKVDAAKVDSLFTGRPVPLKRNLDEATANKYRDVLIKAGAMVEIYASDASPANAAPKPAPAPRRTVEPAAPVAATPAPVAASWTLAPLGADLLPAQERPAQPAPVRVDISGLSLRAAEGNLVDVSEVHEEVAVQVVAPDLGLAAVGADLIGADEKLALPLVEIELEDWGIAEAGSDLLTDDERPIVLPAIVEIGDFGLAPAGSDLGQLKPNVKPVTPDISALRLADSGS
ncbi:hypothetical protein [Cellvibrio sp. OA-2007]|uniref:hypothetical protein n=1 Tax=Cellvibrio sp. OA-2007 TaxID=529823 RepID=UPI000782B051|nr:hypothetical protein [Cellvibrio sp. OA-2007]